MIWACIHGVRQYQTGFPAVFSSDRAPIKYMLPRRTMDTLKALQINFNNLTLNKVMVGYVVDFADDCNNGLRGAPKSSSGLSATAASTSSAPATRSSVR